VKIGKQLGERRDFMFFGIELNRHVFGSSARDDDSGLLFDASMDLIRAGYDAVLARALSAMQ
jgi:hypothetical protein